MNVVAIRAELAAALAGIGITPYDYEPESAELPACFVGFPDPIRYEPDAAEGGTYAGGIAVEIQILVIVDRKESRYAQMRLAAACSDVDTTDTIDGILDTDDPHAAAGIVIQPVQPALVAHQTTAWSSLRVVDASGYGDYQIAGDSGLGVVFTVELLIY